MRKFYLFTFLLVAVFSSHGKTVTLTDLANDAGVDVSFLKDKEYLLFGTVTISKDDEFVIGSGETLRFTANGKLIVEGKMNFTPEERAYITLASGAAAGNSIEINGDNAWLTMDNVTVTGESFLIQTKNPIHISNCEFDKTIYSPAVMFWTQSDGNIIENSVFKDGESAAIQCRSRVDLSTGKAYSNYVGVIVKNNSVTNCCSVGKDYGMIDLSVAWSWDVMVVNNKVYGAKRVAQAGISISNVAPELSKEDYKEDKHKVTIDGNNVENCSKGIEFMGWSNARIINNTLIDNRWGSTMIDAYVSGLGGMGLGLNSLKKATAFVSGNRIEGSLKGVWIWGWYDVNMGYLNVDGVKEYNVGNNKFSKNGSFVTENIQNEAGSMYSPEENPIDVDARLYEFAPLYAQGNYWGDATSEEEIRRGVLGDVIIMPLGDPAGAEMIETENLEEELYFTLDGLMLSGRPSKSGIYIRKKGKRVEKIKI